MRKYSVRRMVLLIDFDEDSQRLRGVREKIPEDLSDRVFVLGVLSEPERLRTDVEMSFEEIGKALADDCVNDTRSANGWGHDLLSHKRGGIGSHGSYGSVNWTGAVSLIHRAVLRPRFRSSASIIGCVMLPKALE